MTVQPLFPQIVDSVTQWFDQLGLTVATRLLRAETADHCRVWQLEAQFPELDGGFARVILKHDFPLSPARLEVPKEFCFRYPHIESDGHLCHGEEPLPADFDKPVEAVGRVLSRLESFLAMCQSPSWCEAEFHRERKDYWRLHTYESEAPKSYRTKKLLLDVDLGANTALEVRAVNLSLDGDVFASSSADAPERIAKSRGWPLGTIVHGAALVVSVPAAERWTPSSWPKTYLELNELVSQLTETPNKVADWYARRWPNKAPVFVVLCQESVAFSWRLVPPRMISTGSPTLVPVAVERVDRQWCLSRGHKVDGLSALTSKKVAVLGCGSLGSPVIELLARAGVGHIEVVDPELFEAANISRHLLGASSIQKFKAQEISQRLEKEVPGSKVTPFRDYDFKWLASASKRGLPDLVIDCTGERSVRIATTRKRDELLGGTPVLMGWMEPGCAAAHAILVTGSDTWPVDDPANTAINIAVWPDDLLVQLPACSQGFHPYGMADAWRVAGLVAERALAFLSGEHTTSGVWSLVRNKAFFDKTSSGLTFNLEPPSEPSIESQTIFRSLPVEIL